MRITLEIGNSTKGRSLINFLKTLGYIKTISVEEESFRKEEELVLPGRKATSKEHEYLAETMDKDESGENVEVVFERLLRPYSK